MREEIRPINRLFVRYWVTDNVLTCFDYTFNYSTNKSFYYDYTD